jgi:hypothetical protein
LVAEPESFIVEDAEGPLAEGELDCRLRLNTDPVVPIEM